MTQINAVARVRYYRDRNPLKRRRYSIYLYVEDVYTGLHWHDLTKRQAKRMGPMITANAAELLAQFDLMEEVYAAVSAAQHQLPAEGSKVRLTEAIGPFPKGLIGTVVHAEWEEDVREEFQTPVTVALITDKESAQVPLALNEYELVK